jgi:hypothetical protein
MKEQYIYITGSLSIFHQNIVGNYDLLDLNETTRMEMKC